jgi:hypothetical protein
MLPRHRNCRSRDLLSWTFSPIVGFGSPAALGSPFSMSPSEEGEDLSVPDATPQGVTNV